MDVYVLLLLVSLSCLNQHAWWARAQQLYSGPFIYLYLPASLHNPVFGCVWCSWSSSITRIWQEVPKLLEDMQVYILLLHVPLFYLNQHAWCFRAHNNICLPPDSTEYVKRASVACKGGTEVSAGILPESCSWILANNSLVIETSEPLCNASLHFQLAYGNHRLYRIWDEYSQIFAANHC